VRKLLLSRGVLIFSAACLVCLFAATLSSHQGELQGRRYAVLTDWTTHHVLYPLHGSPNRMMAAGRDPRSTFSWLRYDANAPRWRDRRHRHRDSAGFDRDWSISLGPTAGTAANMYPAKFTFDITAAPSCANDYIVYPVNAAGSSTQPNLVAFNNLYSGTAGGTGICNRTPATNDDGVDATVLWSYNVSAIGGAVTTSPALSWDSSTGAGSVLGTKVAFVESAPGSPAHFHVLAFKAGDGQDTTDADGLQNTLKPTQITSFVITDPAAGSGTATDLALGVDPTGTDTLSSPYVDYTHDYAYVGNDIGVLYRIKDVFCPSYNTDGGCTAGAGPSIDTSWGTAGSVLVGGGCGVLTGAVDDSVTGDVFVGCSDGRLYGYTSTGTPLPPSHSIAVGDGSIFGGIVVPPIVDSSNGFVYAVAGTNNASPVVTQVPIGTFSNNAPYKRSASLGLPPTIGENLSVPTFNTAYFSSPTFSNWAILSCGYDPTTGSTTLLYDVGFTSSARALNTGTPPASNRFLLASDVETCSPLTGFTNVVSGPPFPSIIDWLFLSLSGGSLSNYDLNGTTGSAGFAGGFAATANFSVSGGSSGIIPDNESTAAQASSIYLSGLGTQTCGITGTGYCAVKLTQAGLN
jgi:hypothetical protein